MKVIDCSAKVAISIFGGADIAQAARLMRDQHVGFLVVSLVGIIAMEDVISVGAGMISDVAGSISGEQRREWRSRVA